MHVVVVGCGRVGATSAGALVAAGHDVVVVDRRAGAFRRLGDEFAGRTMVGVGFDRAVLTDSGVTPDSAVLAVTSGDNSNILIARVAREMFGVRRVVARIYDPKRAMVYERLGVPTVASVTWTSARVLRAVLALDDHIDWSDPSGTHVMVERRVPPSAAGQAVSQLDEAGHRVCLLTRGGHAEIPPGSVLLQEDDLIHVMTAEHRLPDLDATLGNTSEGAR